MGNFKQREVLVFIDNLIVYLYGGVFTVLTDSNPLLISAKLDTTSYRWLSSLSTFNLKIQYRTGKQKTSSQDVLISDLLTTLPQKRVKKISFSIHSSPFSRYKNNRQFCQQR